MEEASWDEVLDRFAHLLRDAAAGQRRLLWFCGGPRPRLAHALARRLGYFVSGMTIVRRVPAVETAASLLAGALYPEERWRPYGSEAGTPDLIVAWGADPAGGAWRTWLRIERWRAAGARLAVVDPRTSDTARAAVLHLPLRPGTDVAAALTLAQLLHARRPCGGSDVPGGLLGALAAWPAARAADLCGVPEDALHELADALDSARAPLFLVGGGLGRHAEAAAAAHAVSLLVRIAHARVFAPEPAPDPADAAPLPIGGEAREVSSGALEAELAARDPRRDLVVIERGDPLADIPSAGVLRAYLVRAAFVVALQDHWGRACAQADLVLPVPSFLERADVEGQRWPAGVRAGRAALPPRRDARGEAAILRMIARRLGWADRWFPADLAGLLEGGPGLDHLPRRRPGGPGRWEPPVYRESGDGPRSSPDLYRAFRLFLVVGSGDLAGRGAAGRAGRAVDTGGPPVVLAAADAAVRGIRAGDRVVVHNDRVQIRALAVVDPAAVPGVAVLPQAWTWGGQAAALSAESAPPAPPGRDGLAGVGEISGPILVEVSRV